MKSIFNVSQELFVVLLIPISNSAKGPSPHTIPRLHLWGVALLEGWRLWGGIGAGAPARFRL